jgi:Prophage tail length tape measure protein/Lambda phage tail tape-measure protein (Tape_meas_lam_C)
MTEKRVSVRLAAVGGDRLKAELVAVGREGKRALSTISGATAPASRGLEDLGHSAGAALGQLEALAARATQTAARLRAAGASTGTLVERIDQVTGVAPRMRRSAEDIAAYGGALDELRARHNPLFAVIRAYKGELAAIRQAHAVGALSADEMAAAISRERQAALASIAAIKGRGVALQAMGGASRAAAFQSRMLMFQLNDVFVSLASGMNPLMVFVQQGAQIAQIYGGEQGGVRGALRDTARMIGGVVTRFPLVTAAVLAGSAAIAGMRSAINATSKTTVGFGDVALAVWQTARDGLMRVLRPAIEAIAPWFSAAWRLVVDGVHWTGNSIINGFRAAFEAVRATWTALPDILGAAVVGAANLTIAGVETMVNRAIALLNGLGERVNGLLAKVPGLPGDWRVGTLEPVAIRRLENPYAGRVGEAAGALGGRLSEIMASDPLGGFFDAVRERAVANALDETANAADRAGGAVRGAAEAAKPATEKAAEAVEGWASALDDFAARSKDLGKGIGDALASGFSAAEEAVGEFVRSGKLDMRSLVTSMLADFAQVSARRFLLGPLASALTGTLGRLGPTFASVLHAGGLAGSHAPQRLVPAFAFADAPRLHGGGVAGLRPDEVPAILQRGERVLSRAEARGFDRARGDGGVSVTIVARDAESFRQSRTQVASDIARAVAFGRRGM